MAVVEIPEAYRDLLERPLLAALSTLMPDGSIQTNPVWFDLDGRCVRVNTMRGFRKERNLRADPRATVLIVDPDRSGRWIEVRGMADLSEAGAAAHLDGLARRYVGVDHYFGGAIPAEFAATEVPVLVRITPLRIVTDVTADPRRRATSNPEPAGPVPLPERTNTRSIAIPPSHRDLLDRALPAVLSTRMPNGQPQTQPVWFEFDGCDLLINTTRERQKGRNLERDPRGTILVVDRDDDSRWIEIRGRVDLTEEGAPEELDRLTRRYTGNAHHFGSVYPIDWRGREHRVIARIHPHHVVCDAIHRAPVQASPVP